MLEKDTMKALRCIAGREEIPCSECAYNAYNKKSSAFNCKKKVAKDALAIINSKGAENVQLRYAIKKERAKNNENDL